jgi:hypothetical protein
MSKIGNHRVEVQESDDYRFGWESAERGDPRPDWEQPHPSDITRLVNQRCGWDDYHVAHVAP